MQKYNEKPLIMSDIIRGSAVNIPNDATIYTVSEPSQVVDEMEYIIVNPIEYSPTSIENFIDSPTKTAAFASADSQGQRCFHP